MEMVSPIRSVTIPGLSTPVELTGLIVVVGPNSSGKTQFLHDINEVVRGRNRKLVVASSVRFNAAPGFEEYFNLLINNGALRERQSNNFQKRSFQFGADDGGGEFHKNHANGYHGQYTSSRSGKTLADTIPASEFLSIFGAFSCSSLFLRNRLTLMDKCRNFNAKENPPTTTLQALHLNPAAKKKLQGEIGTVFNRGVWVDQIGEYGNLVVRVSDSPTVPPAEDQIEPDRMNKYRGIETEGDGIRSYCAVCATLLLERRPLCILDEPEMCLHPPQAHAMGRFIGTHVTSGTATLVATHSSHVLRGILESNPNARVIRLSRAKSEFAARLLQPEALAEATSKPKSRSEAILEGIFAQAVVLCEAEGDRVVYESAYQTLKDRRLDIRFIPSEGTGGFADPLRLYTALGVPSAVIADLDMLGKETELKNVLSILISGTAKVHELSIAAREAMRQIRSAATCLEVTQAQSELKDLSALVIDSLDALRGKLIKLIDQMYRLRALKLKGIDSIPEKWHAEAQPNPPISLRNDVEGILKELQLAGLFLVPVGELESWMPVLMDGIDRSDKSRWAMLAAEKIEDVGEAASGICEFVRSVAQFLSSRFVLEPTEPASDGALVV